ncbi:membrane protein [Arenicella chitinivorans]|uniref:Membrane protein n=1 Tax=Arenicella chitinivorans TaxID=1329800 RepID=A0A918RSL1_9GAMM|nr:MMPL family transporter [Arenicella chitinivorans]GHA06994.1 membrane protein [Arenicella chitinivorans]
MSQSNSLYDTLVFRHAKWVLLLFILIAGALSPYAKEFRLDASSDSLVLENDESLKYFREVVSQYAGDELLLVTYKPHGDLFASATLDDLGALREKLLTLDLVKSIISILDAPLTQSPPVTLAELATNPQTLRDARTDLDLAKQELTGSALYRDLLVSDDLSTTAIVMSLAGDAEVSALLDKRNALREKRAEGTLSSAEAAELEAVTKEHQVKADAAQARQAAMIAQVRGIMQEHEANAKLFLGGLPMIVADSVAYINADVMTFGLAALAVIVLILTIAFRQFGWIVMPLINCAATGFIIVCLLGLLNWPISVVSSNFLSLLLIITLSLNIHLIVRYRELAKLHPDHDQTALLSSTVRSKFIPCLYTALTTIVAFASLIVSGIRPVIDFGWIMCLGIVVAFITTFTLFPALAVWMRPRAVKHNRDPLSKLILNGAQSMHQRGVLVSLFFTVIAVAAIYGIANLTVENRFIDYFKPDTEIYQGMVEIDEQLGGTTPMDIILDAPAEFLATKSASESPSEEADEDDFEDDDFFDEFEDEESGDNIVISSYWFNKQGLDKLKAIQRSLDDIPATGKVMSLATSMSVFEGLRDQGPMDNIDLSFMLTVLSDDNKKTLIDPYLSEDGNQTHINIRVFETFRGLDRDQLISDIRTMLIEEHGLQDEQINISGMVVLYNNMLNSLFNSQIMTLGTVFVVIFLMFIVLFRSVKLALISIIPNVFSAAVVLGIMGIFSIPLDLMTITIAAISVGIAVDNSIHFVHRYRDEMRARADNRAAINSATLNVGQAMFYTTLVITAGFLIMVFSNFVPTMYFGVLTGIAMVTALIANLVMLPMLVAAIKPIEDA